MNRKFVTICLSCLAAVALPAAVLFGLGLWTHIPELWSLTLQTVPLSLMFAGLVNFVWFCGPPKPSSRMEAFGRWFLVFVMSAGVGLECTAFFPLLASWINNTPAYARPGYSDLAEYGLGISLWTGCWACSAISGIDDENRRWRFAEKVI